MLPAIFVAAVLAALARWRWYPSRSWLVLLLAGCVGGLVGLAAGWAVTGQDGSMLGYGLLVMLEAGAVMLAGGRT